MVSNMAPYVVIKREDLCPCGIIAQHYFLHENMIRCPYPDNEITLYYIHTKILLDFHVKGENRERVFQAKLLLKPLKTSIRDLKVIQGKFPKVLVRRSLKDTPVELPTAIEAIETDQKYYDTQETQAQVEQMVDYWWKEAKYLNTITLVFALVSNFVLLVLMIVFILGYKFRKKLATLIVTLSQTKPLKALEIDGLYTTKAATLPVQLEKDDAVIIKNVAWILISAIVSILLRIILKKIYRLHCYKSSFALIFWPCCMRRDYIRNTFTTDIFIEVVHLLTNNITCAHLLTLPVVLTSLGYRGSITLENLNLTTHCCYFTLDIEWGDFKLYVHYDPIVLPKRGYIYGCQPNLLTEFDAPGPYRIQFMASYLDLCTPIPPANIQGPTPY